MHNFLFCQKKIPVNSPEKFNELLFFLQKITRLYAYFSIRQCFISAKKKSTFFGAASALKLPYAQRLDEFIGLLAIIERLFGRVSQLKAIDETSGSLARHLRARSVRIHLGLVLVVLLVFIVELLVRILVSAHAVNGAELERVLVIARIVARRAILRIRIDGGGGQNFARLAAAAVLRLSYGAIQRGHGERRHTVIMLYIVVEQSDLLRVGMREQVDFGLARQRLATLEEAFGAHFGAACALKLPQAGVDRVQVLVGELTRRERLLGRVVHLETVGGVGGRRSVARLAFLELVVLVGPAARRIVDFLAVILQV